MKTPATQPPPRRRRFWPRFTLRVLLVVVTLVCVGLAIWTQRAREQKRVADQIRLSGGQIDYDFERENISTWVATTYPFHDVSQFHFNFGENREVENESHVPRWLLERLGEDFFHTVVLANVRDCDELQDIGSLWYLQKLTVGRGINDDDIKHVAGLRHLKQLQVAFDSRMTDDALVSLAAMPALEVVSIEGDFTAQGLRALARSPSLREVNVSGCDDSVDQSVVEAFRREGRVKTLWLHAESSQPTRYHSNALGGWIGDTAGLPVLGYDE